MRDAHAGMAPFHSGTVSRELPAIVPRSNVPPVVSPVPRDGIGGAGSEHAPGTAGAGGAGGNVSGRIALDRSGIELARLMADDDRISVRAGSTAQQLSARLEAARGALVANRAADALALLDEGWSTAQRTEEGWYLRGGSLAALGLPGEALRVASDALRQLPDSIALRYLSALARLTAGDNAGARTLLQEVLAEAPEEPVLLAQYAVTLSGAGRREAALRILRQLVAQSPAHPAVAYAEARLAADHANNARHASREFQEDAAGQPSGITRDAGSGADAAGGTGRADGTGGTGGAHRGTSPAWSTSADSIESLMHRLSALLDDGRPPAATVESEIRLMLRAISAGGTLASSGTPRQLHAARSVLTALLAVITETGSESNSSGEPLREILVHIRDGRFGEARQSLVRNEGTLSASVRSLLRALLGDHEPRRSARGTSLSGFTAADPEVLTDRALQEAHKSVIGPVRLGLSLVSERVIAGIGTALISGGVWEDTVHFGAVQGERADGEVPSAGHASHAAQYAGVLSRGTPLRLAALNGSGEPVADIADPTRSVGWDAAPDLTGARRRNSELLPGTEGWAQILAIACAGLATLAMMTGRNVIAFALFGGVAWLAFRHWSVDSDERSESSGDVDRGVRDRDGHEAGSQGGGTDSAGSIADVSDNSANSGSGRKLRLR